MPIRLLLKPWQLMLIILASWVNQEQQEVIEYIRSEIAAYEDKFGKNLFC